MSDKALDEFLDAYDRYRIKDQEDYLARRTKEYLASDRQASGFAELLLFLAGVSGIVAAGLPTYALLLGLLAASFAAAATVVTGWADLVGFSKNAQLFRAAGDQLAHTRPRRPRGPQVANDDARAYVDQMEDILVGEVRAWGKEWGRADGGPRTSE